MKSKTHKGENMKIIIAVLTCMLLLANCSPGDPVQIERDLVSFGNGSSMHGDFFLGIGSVGGVSVYRYLYKYGDGGIKQSQISVNLAVVYEKYKKGSTKGKMLISCGKRSWASQIHVIAKTKKESGSLV